MNLEVYRSCSWREKREVLNAFWRSGVDAPAKIAQAALEYGRYCVPCMYVVALELALIAAAGIVRGSYLGWIALSLETFVGYWTWWSVVRLRALKSSATS